MTHNRRHGLPASSPPYPISPTSRFSMLRSTRVLPIAALILTTGLFACTDQPEDITAPAVERAAGVSAQSQSGPSSLDLIEQDYEGGLLDKDNANRYRQYAVLAPEKLPSKYRTDAIGKDATYSMVQLAKEF